MVRHREHHTAPSLARWSGVQRQVRLLVPAPVRRVDLAGFQALARRRAPILDRGLPGLSRAANHSALWLALAVVLAGSGTQGRRAALRGVAAIAITSAVTNLPAKLLTGRARPDLRTVPEARRLARVPTSTSFPSGHAASAFAFSTAVGAEMPRLRWPLLGLAGAVGLSRVHTGVHYPGDVLAGAAIGVVVARATLRAWAVDDPQAGATPLGASAGVGPGGEGLVVAVNADAGSRGGRRALRRLQRDLPRLRTVDATPDEPLRALLRRAADGAAVLGVAGGDGTTSAGAQVAQERGLPLLIVPAGTFNHLARDLGISTPSASVRAVREARKVVIDLGVFDGRVFVNAIGFGLYPQFVARREQLTARVGKAAAAALAAIITLTTGDAVDVEVDGRLRRVWVLAVGNGPAVSERLTPARRRRLDEGLFDIRLVGADRPWARTRFAAAVLLGRGERSGVQEHWLADRLALRLPDRATLLARDGELEASPSAGEVTVLPRSLEVLQPLARSRRPPRRGGA